MTPRTVIAAPPNPRLRWTKTVKPGSPRNQTRPQRKQEDDPLLKKAIEIVTGQASQQARAAGAGR